MYQEVIELFSQFTHLSERDKEIIEEVFTSKSLKKDEYFLKEGDYNRKAAILTKGLVRYFVIRNGEESTLEFTKEKEFITDFPSFAQRGISKQYIQAVEDCELLEVSYDGIQRMYDELSNGNLIGRKILEQRYIISLNQLMSIYMHNPEQRYQQFIEQYKDIAQRIPQYLIASFVGIKPQSLSRIRSRMARK